MTEQQKKIHDVKAHFDLNELSINALSDLQKYRRIGTAEEFKQLKEKATAKKPKMIVRFGCTTHECPNCGQLLHDDQNFCHDCGIELDWSEGKE
jgi:predicted RNA-binding Zn-ribbon protein involved in translation (DUF1610 family)